MGGSICPHGRQRDDLTPSLVRRAIVQSPTRRRRRVRHPRHDSSPSEITRGLPCDGNAAITSRPSAPTTRTLRTLALVLVPAGALAPRRPPRQLFAPKLSGNATRRCSQPLSPNRRAAPRRSTRGWRKGRGRRARRCETDACRRRTPRPGRRTRGRIVGEIVRKEIIRRRPEIIRRASRSSVVPLLAFHPSASSRSSRSPASARVGFDPE